MTLAELIRAIAADCDPLDENRVIAEKVAGQYGTLTAYRDATWTLLIDEVRRVRREDDRAAQAAGAMREGGRAVDPTEDRRRWLSMRVLTPGREPVTFGQATVEDHQAHIDYLRKLWHGIGNTIAVHEVAISQIQAAGATCLADIELVAVA